MFRGIPTHNTYMFTTHIISQYRYQLNSVNNNVKVLQY